MNFIKSNNSITAIGLIGIVITMIALAYASVPLYNYFCKVTGFGALQMFIHLKAFILSIKLSMLD